MTCPQCGSGVSEDEGSPVSPYLNVYRCQSCDWIALRCGDTSCDGYLELEEMGRPDAVRYNCAKCGWTGTGTRFP